MNEEKVKKYSKDGMICCGIITIISIVGFIFITIFDRNISDIAVFGGLFVLLIITCVFGFVKFYKQFNNPNNKKVNNNAKTYRGYLYNSEWNWDIAEANYRIQYNKKDTDLNEKDEEIIWKYCCTEIAFYLAWLVENEFLTLDPVINETIEKVKKRQTMPDDLFECIGKNGNIPWKIKGEQKQFRELTTGNVVIMGRKSYEEIGHPLPNRMNIVVSTTTEYQGDNLVSVSLQQEMNS